MRVPQFERYARLSQGAALLVVGAIIGAIVYHSIFFLNFEALKNTVIDLEDKLSQNEKDIQRLTQFKKQHTIIKSILPIMEEDVIAADGNTKIDELTERVLKEKIREELDVLVGRSIYDIDSDAKLARQILARKQYKVLEKEYTIEIKTILVADNVLQVWFKAREQNQTPE
jgi:hypothetical protein